MPHITQVDSPDSLIEGEIEGPWRRDGYRNLSRNFTSLEAALKWAEENNVARIKVRDVLHRHPYRSAPRWLDRKPDGTWKVDDFVARAVKAGLFRRLGGEYVG